ncbi:patatin-like phospholipase family protein [Vibrio hangzhouensis]|uniref:Predicted phospholipase, patatin/cPLA2 family n=1 Tax=Vibrio hangzhouensis TaxID=462991 RepID=A0A1H5WX42_9VIBR|nr:patatin family protein [Vibrio hangzhouensis]SEG03998.1 Predicted phospholipase, patatin/cPLA2 family [Vibrio hangzhouensis]
MTQETKHALVVEGGAMRGIFAAGVLDGFIDHSYNPFDFCIGVSAGATNIASWLSEQRGRTYTIIADYSCRPEFINFRKFAGGGHWLDLDWLWDHIAIHYPYDMQAFNKQSIPFHIVTTDVNTGYPVYTLGAENNLEMILKASCSVPMAYRTPLTIKGRKMIDGGVADSIPVIEAYNRGARVITVILSQKQGYIKRPPKAPWLLRRFMKNTPQLAEAMINRAEQYNQTMAFINNPPPDCTIRVITPEDSFSVGRLTTNKDKLEAGYQMGLRAARNVVQQMP